MNESCIHVADKTQTVGQKMTDYLPSSTRAKVQQPRFLSPCTPTQRMPDMLTDDAAAHLAKELLRDLGASEARYGAMEMDAAQGVICTQDEHGNVKVSKDS